MGGIAIAFIATALAVGRAPYLVPMWALPLVVAMGIESGVAAFIPRGLRRAHWRVVAVTHVPTAAAFAMAWSRAFSDWMTLVVLVSACLIGLAWSGLIARRSGSAALALSSLLFIGMNTTVALVLVCLLPPTLTGVLGD